MPVRPLGFSVRKRAYLLQTGQVTQYSSELDDGYYQKGLPKSYTILTTGSQSGTSNVDLAHYVGTDIAAVKGAPDTYTSATIDFTTLFKAADVLVLTGFANSGNNGAHTIAAAGVAAHTITLTSSNALTSEAAGPSITISKREAISNNVVHDNQTGLDWTRYRTTKFGVSSDGNMPWTGQLYDIFAFCAASNSASLGGVSDWRVPNINELHSIIRIEAPAALPDSTAFPSFSSGPFFSSNSRSNSTTNAISELVGGGYSSFSNKTSSTGFCILVRGG